VGETRANAGSGCVAVGGSSADASRTRALFEQVLVADETKRRELLELARRLEPTVCAEVESLLMFHERRSGVLDVEAPAMAARLAAGPVVLPARIGPYAVTRELGRGGMGVVYEAAQEFPKRRVALKTIRPELLSRSMNRRFEHEAEALAALQHPAVAPLYEAGFGPEVMPDGTITSSRVAYLAMELVEGKPLTEAAHAMALPAKIDLLARICDGVDHAHRRGVVHRDLKPGNILVRADGSPKVLDFGVAKLTDAESGGGSIETRVGQIVGTMGYMSPEQVSGDARAVDHRSDVYALGVLMYECLAGEPPLKMGGLSIASAAVLVREREPAPLGRKSAECRGDLEAIAAKALEKDPARRYGSAAALAEDLRRYLRHEPVSARPLTALYHAGKFARRHRGLVASLAAVMVALAGGAVAFAWQAREARHRADDADRTLVFLTEMLQIATPEVAQGRELTMRDAVDRAEAMLERDTMMRPAVRANLHHMLANIYESLYEHGKSLRHFTAMAEIRERVFGADSPEGLHARLMTIWPMHANGRGREAWDLTNAILPRAIRVLGPDHETVVDLHSSRSITASTEYGLSRDEILEIQRYAVGRMEGHYGKDSIEADRERMNHAVTLMNFGDAEAAIPMMRACVAWRREKQGPDHPSLLVAMNNLGGVLCNHGDFDEGLGILRETLAGSERLWGADNISTIRRRHDVIMMMFGGGRLDEAEAVLRRQLPIVIKLDGPAGDWSGRTRGMLTTIMLNQGRLDEAEASLESLYRDTLAAHGPDAAATKQVATLRFDLCERRRDAAGMRKWAEFLQGTEWGEEAMKQAVAASAKFAAEDAAKPGAGK
jgi:eukaryotic-like serine/threonine-protein kinase